MDEFDIVVLGGGPGGYVAAIRAAQLGAKVAIIEKDSFGGTCLNRGCIPTKTFVKNAEIINSINNAFRRGISVSEPQIDMVKMIAAKNSIVKQLSGGVKSLLTANGVSIFNGFGKIAADKKVVISQNKQETVISYKKLIIATGSENAIPPIPGIDEGVLTSTELLNVEQVPKSLAIIGGGVIGCEFAAVFSEFGTEVTIIEMLPRLIPNMDEDLSAQLKKNLERKKVRVMVDRAVKSIKKLDGKYKLSVRNSGGDLVEVSAEKLLVSVGRRPNLDGLEYLKFERNGKYIKVDSEMKTSVEDVYAIGDITGTIQLAHVASTQGIIAAQQAMGKGGLCNLEVVPSCIYTLPEIGSVGLTEVAAKEMYGDILVGKFPVVALGKALAMGENEGSFKVIADAKTKKVLGVHIFGSNATDLIMEAALVIQNGGTLETITETIYAHPTMAEGIMEAAHAAEGLCIHMPPTARR